MNAGASGLGAAAAELIGPLSAAATPEPLPWMLPGVVQVPIVTRAPIVLCTLLETLTGDPVTVGITVDGLRTELRFEAWSEHGTQLPAHCPATDAVGTAAPFTVEVEAVGGPPGLVRLELVQGRLGALLYTLLAEKARLRRQSRELVAMRTLRHARDDALDRIGRDLGCPRFADDLVWDSVARQVATVAAPETDASYRDRLSTLRGFRLPSPARIEETAGVDVAERPDPLLVAFRLTGPAKARARLLEAVRGTHLVWPQGSAAGDAAHRSRLVPPAAVTQIAPVRAALRELASPDPVSVAVGRALRRLLDHQRDWNAAPFSRVLNGQRDNGGSRYELGLGALLAAPDQAELAKAVAAAGNAAVPVADDPAGEWLLRSCGLRTAHPLADGTVYVSGVNTGGLVIGDGPAPSGLTARIEDAADPGHDAPLAAVITALAAAGFAAEADPAALVAGVRPTASAPAIRTVLAELDLPQVTDPAALAARFAPISTRSWDAFDLGPAATAQLTADPSRLAALLRRVERAGASSCLAVVTATGSLALLVGLVDLPLAGGNLAARSGVAYRWQARGLVRHPAELEPRTGPGVRITAPGEGVSVVVCQAYVRGGGVAPYQWRPVLPDGRLLSLREYERLMNVVELATPLGVRADTWELRRRHVDVDGSGTPVALPLSAARTYRRYRPGH